MKYLGLMIAVVVAIAAAFFVLQVSQPPPPPPPPTQPVQVTQRAEPVIKEVNIYVAARDIPIGAVIDANMLTTRPWPAHLVVDGFVVGADEGQKIIQTVVRAPFKRNEPINRAKLVNPKDPNFLAGELPKGMRLVTMSADEISAVAGFVFPGDRVDVLVTHRVIRDGVGSASIRQAGENSSQVSEEVTEMLLQNARVMAVDQRATGGVEESGGIVIPRSISLEVSPEDAQRVRLAQEIGELSLALRSVADRDDMQKIAATRRADLTSAGSGGQTEDDPSPSGEVRVIRGTQIEVLEGR